MSDEPRDYRREVRDTVVKSSLTGVAATVLAVTVFSPAGFGGMVGTSLASGFGVDTNAAQADDPYANLPPYPAPLTSEEISDIQDQLARTTVSLEITRAATEAKIDHIRSLAMGGDMVTFSAVPQTAQVGAGLRLRTNEPESVTASVRAEAAPQPVEAIQVSYGGPDQSYRDPNMELADLLLAHETF